MCTPLSGAAAACSFQSWCSKVKTSKSFHRPSPRKPTPERLLLKLSHPFYVVTDVSSFMSCIPFYHSSFLDLSFTSHASLP